MAAGRPFSGGRSSSSSSGPSAIVSIVIAPASIARRRSRGVTRTGIESHRTGRRLTGMSESIGDFEPSAPGDDVTDETTTAPVEFDPFSRAYFDGPDEIYARLRDEAP